MEPTSAARIELLRRVRRAMLTPLEPSLAWDRILHCRPNRTQPEPQGFAVLFTWCRRRIPMTTARKAFTWSVRLFVASLAIGIALLAVGGIGRPTNCGGNSAAISACG